MRLLGREREAARLDTLLAGDRRVIGISGRAGVGKTALLASLGAAPARDADVWTVDLDGAQDMGLGAAVARRLGIGATTPLRAEASAASRVARVVGASPVLLAVDHAEGCIVDDVEASLLLEACPRLRIVIARSTPLGGSFEDVPLLPLDVPAAGARTEELLGYASVQLFVDRALRVDERFRADPPTVEAVAEICRLLGGLPLAIELAAARVRVMPPHRLAEDLADTADALDLLSPREGFGRPGLREALGATVHTLGERERRVLEHISCFVGPFPFDAAVAVTGDPPSEVADALERLIDVRLVDHGGASSAEPAFSLLPIVRRFVAEAGVSAAAASARRMYLERTLADAERACARADAAAATAPARGLRRDLVAEARRRFDADPLDAAKWLTACAAVLAGDAESIVIGEYLEMMIAAGRLDALPADARARIWLWSAHALAFSPDGTALADVIRERCERGAALVDADAEPLLAMQCRHIRILTAVTTGDLLPAVQAAREGRELALAHAQPTWAARFEVWIAAAIHATGEIAASVELAVDALHHAERVGDAQAIAGATIVLHAMAPGTVPADAAVPSLEDVLELVRRDGNTLYEWFVLGALTHAEIASGRPHQAAHWCALRLAGSAQRGWSYLVAISLVHTVLIATALGEFAFAARVLGAISADRDRVLRAMVPTTAGELDRVRDVLERRIGIAHSTAVMAAGSVLTLADASAEAARWLRAHATAPEPEAPQPSRDRALTTREREVLEVLAQGHPNKVIAQRLGVSTKTVMHHSGAIYRKLGVRGRAEATAYAHRHGLVAPGES